MVKLKNQVLYRIDKITDESLLEEILNLIDFESENEEIFDIPTEHNQELEISLEQMRNGDFASNEEVDAKVKKWLLK